MFCHSACLVFLLATACFAARVTQGSVNEVDQLGIFALHRSAKEYLKLLEVRKALTCMIAPALTIQKDCFRSSVMNQLRKLRMHAADRAGHSRWQPKICRSLQGSERILQCSMGPAVLLGLAVPPHKLRSTWLVRLLEGKSSCKDVFCPGSRLSLDCSTCASCDLDACSSSAIRCAWVKDDLGLPIFLPPRH